MKILTVILGIFFLLAEMPAFCARARGQAQDDNGEITVSVDQLVFGKPDERQDNIAQFKEYRAALERDTNNCEDITLYEMNEAMAAKSKGDCDKLLALLDKKINALEDKKVLTVSLADWKKFFMAYNDLPEQLFSEHPKVVSIRNDLKNMKHVLTGMRVDERLTQQYQEIEESLQAFEGSPDNSE